jgi:hypothetical protein
MMNGLRRNAQLRSKNGAACHAKANMEMQYWDCLHAVGQRRNYKEKWRNYINLLWNHINGASSQPADGRARLRFFVEVPAWDSRICSKPLDEPHTWPVHRQSTRFEPRLELGAKQKRGQSASLLQSASPARLLEH